MSRLMPYLCVGSIEVANLARITTYGSGEFFEACPCPALDDVTYTDPVTDDAPWYDASHPESEDFIGFLPQSITLSAPVGRTISALTEGSEIGPERLDGRVLEVLGWMVARDAWSMHYGKSWLTEALRGNRCDSCSKDVLTVLPFCRDENDPLFDYAVDLRSMVGAALVDGPRFVELSDDPDYIILTTQFQMKSSMPYLYTPAVRCIDDEALDSAPSCALTTPEWTEEGTFVIDITNADSVPTTDILITGQISLDGTCPVDPPGDSVPASFSYSIPSIPAEGRLVIDGTRRKVFYYDPSAKVASSGLFLIDFDGPFPWPDVGICTTICLTVQATGYSGDATVSVDTYLRSL